MYYFQALNTRGCIFRNLFSQKQKTKKKQQQRKQQLSLVALLPLFSVKIADASAVKVIINTFEF